jgi:diaminopimelate decarboxylase
MEQQFFLTDEQALAVRDEFGSPLYVYDQRSLAEQARQVLAFPNAFGMTARYAMKALPNGAVLRILHEAGLHIDASSSHEVERAMRAGIPAGHIQLTAQEPARNLKELIDKGVLFNACSVNQLRQYGELFPNTDVSIRINPGLGSGHSNRTNVGGPAASFGIWHEHLDQVFDVQQQFGLRITQMHTHVGSGADPEVWHHCSELSLGIAARLPDVTSLSLGGGFKVGRMPGEISADLTVIGERVKRDFEAFAGQHGRELQLEIEPGTFLVANAGAVVCSVVDIVDTGENGYRFIKTDSGMTEITRTCLYGAQHPIKVVPADGATRGQGDYLVVGHCCESGDVLTPAPGDPEGLQPRTLTEAQVGDAVVVGGAGAYCAAMATKNYNSFPEAAEVLLDHDGQPRLIRKRQSLDQLLANEVLD